MALFVALVLLTVDLARAQITACTTLIDNIDNVSVSWASKYPVMPSNPPCLDASNRYLLRTCTNAGWSHFGTSECHHLSSDKTCGDSLLSIDQYCALVTPPQQFDDLCPEGFLKYYNYSRVDPKLEYWSPIRRVDDVFTHIGTDSLYGIEFIAPGQRSNCFVVSEGKDIPKFCNRTFHQLCITPKGHVPFSNIVPGVRMDLLLKFDRKRGKVLLNIYTPQNILQKLDDPIHDAIYCFTNADETELKSLLKIKRVVNKKKLRVYQISVKYEHPGQYWCEVFDRNQTLIRSNTLIGYKKKRGHEYSLRLKVKGMCPEANCIVLGGKEIMNFLEEIKFYDNFRHVEVVVRVMKIFGKSGGNVDAILHLTTVRNFNIYGEYYMLLDIIKKIDSIEMLWFRSADYCLPETTEFSLELKWKLTPVMEESCPDQLCLNNKALPYKRKCLGNFLEGAYWDDFHHECYSDVSITATTKELYNISINGVLSAQNLQDIQNLTTDTTQIIPLDVFLIANIMNGVEPALESDAAKSEILDNVVGTIDHLMGANKNMLKESQLQLNATDAILDSIERYFEDDASISRLSILTQINGGEEYLIVKPKFILHISKPFLSEVHGIGLYRNPNGTGSFTEEMVMPIKMNQTFEDLENLEDLELATYVPLDLLELIAEDNGSQDNITVVISIFYNDHLFNSEHEELGVPLGKIISVKIPDFGYYLDEPLPILFRREAVLSEANSSCAYWEYGEYATNKTGHWSNLGGSLEDTNYNTTLLRSFATNTTLTQCNFNHLTHFALLIMNQRIGVPEPDVDVTNEDWLELQEEYNFHEEMFSLITLLGSILSMTGVLGIFLTAICFSSWRQKTGSKILVQLSLAIILEVIVVHVAGEEKLSRSKQLCTMVGICLHYVVLSKFSWMFVSAILQYLRFVKIFQVLPSRLILKAMLFAWGFPLIPVILIATLLPEYNAAARQFCYPVDMALYLGLFLPVAIIVFSNCVVFIVIMRNVFNPNIEIKPRSNRKSATAQNKLQIYLGILLFFMLGLPWVFGILGEILAYPYQVVCIYLFCLMATLQGWVIFLFYVVFDRDTRHLWIRAVQRRFKKYNSRSQVSSSAK